MSETPETPTTEPTADPTADATADPTADPTADATVQPAATPRPAAPGAAAASRARRIGGGRPAPRPGTPQPAPARPVGGPAPAGAENSGGGEAAVDLDKRASGPTVQPAADQPAPKGAGPRASKPLPIGDGAPPSVPVWLNWAPAGVLVAGCVVMAVLITIFSHGVWWGPDRAAPPSRSKVAQQREQVMAAAKSCVVTANSYDYRSLAAYEKKALACTTGGQTSQLKKTIEALIMKHAPALKAKQVTQITRGGIETVTPDGKQWTLLLFGQLSVVNTNDPSGRVDPFAAQVRMEKAHGKWVMSKLTVVSLPVTSG